METKFQILLKEKVNSEEEINQIIIWFKVSKSTIQNWKDGISFPHPMIQLLISSKLQEDFKKT